MAQSCNPSPCGRPFRVPAFTAVPCKARPDPVEARRWLTVDDVAEITAQTPETVQEKARRGKVPTFKDGRDWKITPAAFEEWERRASAERVAHGAKNPPRRAPRAARVVGQRATGVCLAIYAANATIFKAMSAISLRSRCCLRMYL